MNTKFWSTLIQHALGWMPIFNSQSINRFSTLGSNLPQFIPLKFCAIRYSQNYYVHGLPYNLPLLQFVIALCLGYFTEPLLYVLVQIHSLVRDHIHAYAHMLHIYIHTHTHTYCISSNNFWGIKICEKLQNGFLIYLFVHRTC